ncbi:MAG: DUF368 domain-containing protein, partial [Bacteroidota bacterium]
MLYFKGMAMGAADAVPGVSGGTIAFISGIYEELINTIKSIDFKAIKLLLSFNIAEFWRYTNATFLLVLLLGILTSILSLSKLLVYFLENYPIHLWSFFFGLILASAWLVARKIPAWSRGTMISLLLGVGLGYLVTVSGVNQTPDNFFFTFLAGAIAICAMILPGISGSFMLVLMGKYKYIFESISAFDFKVLFTFALGCLVGILSFARLVNWLLKKFYNLTIAFLTGIMIGSLNKVWPWKKVLATYIDRHGEEKAARELSISPTHYEALGLGESYLLEAIGLAVLGLALVLLLEKAAVL